MSEHENDTATIERHLTAIDEALDTGAVTHADLEARELQQLALALRHEAPEPNAEFGRELRQRVDAGFPAHSGSARARAEAARARFFGTGRRVLPALATVTVILVPLVLVLTLAGPSGPGAGGDDDSGGSSAGGSVAAESGGGSGGGGAARDSEARVPSNADQSSSALSALPALPRPLGNGFAPGQRARKIERTISLQLDVPKNEMARVADKMTAVTGRYGGFVLSSSVATGKDGFGGDFELRIPTDRLQSALRQLSSLATVRSQEQSGRDVTREQITAKDRLQSARAERRSLLRRLETADTDDEAEALRRRLDLVAGEINGLRGQLRDLRLRTDYAVVTVSLLAGDRDSGDEGGGGGGTFDDALGDAGSLLVGSAGVLIRILALALPIGLIALIAWLAARALRRRRRASVLA